MPETQYLIHNTTRGVETRFQRRAAPEPPRMTLMLGGGTVRVLRNRPQAVTESLLQRMLPELTKLEAAGRLKVTTLAGLRVDIQTFRVVEAPAVSPPLPHPPLDSATRDKNENVGDVIPRHGDPKFIPQSTELPLPAAARGLSVGPVEDELPSPAAELEAQTEEPSPSAIGWGQVDVTEEPATTAAAPEAKAGHRKERRR
ncbi:MAG: hypothetical protein WC372_08500 [Candidatus Neomarinimicrobiota bacterium]|jgi:hypothetical protein